MLDMIADDFLRPFKNPAHLSFISTICARMDNFGLSPAEVVKIIDMELTAHEAAHRDERVQPLRLCPDCKSPLETIRVNSTKCTRIGGDYTHMDVCTSSTCKYSKPFKR